MVKVQDQMKQIRELKPERWFQAAQMFEDWMHSRKTAVAMFSSAVRESAGCGTVACVAGHWAALRGLHHEDTGVDPFEIGCTDLSTFLGFSIDTDSLIPSVPLSLFMRSHPEIWGNTRGGGMFADPKAYVEHDDVTLKDVVSKFREVGHRIELIQKNLAKEEGRCA